MPAKWIGEQLENRNYLSPVGFQLQLDIFKGVDFFCQRANLPDVQMPVTEVPTRFRTFPIVPGGGVTFGDLTVQFIIDEDMINYRSIHDWIIDNGNADRTQTSDEYPKYSSGRLLVLSSNFNTNHIIDYENLFPYSLSSIEFDSGDTTQEYFIATSSFKFTRYTIRNKNFTE